MRENFCHIVTCMKPAANSSLNSNFGPSPDPSTHLCGDHLGEWHKSPEHLRKMVGVGGNTHLPDFCMRIGKEEEVIKERARRAQAEAEAKAKEEKPVPNIAFLTGGRNNQ